jgi:hypothetical protein
MTSHIRAELRRLVHERAGGACEYCLIHERDTYLGCQVDHVVSEKHGGQTVLENLALACPFCNRAKGSDVGSFDDATGELVRFFNPRSDLWNEHFEIQGDRIVPKSIVGQVTERILRFNLPERMLERRALTAIGRYPTMPA